MGNVSRKKPNVNRIAAVTQSFPSSELSNNAVEIHVPDQVKQKSKSISLLSFTKKNSLQVRKTTSLHSTANIPNVENQVERLLKAMEQLKGFSTFALHSLIVCCQSLKCIGAC